MMFTQFRWPFIVIITCTLALGLPPHEAGRARADSSTPTSSAILPSPTPDTPTPAPSLLPPSPEPTATDLPPASEPPAPTATTAPAATEPPSPSPLPVPTRVVRPTPAPTSTPVIAHAPDVPAVAPLPSPAELRLNARLRWGTHVPPEVRRWAFLIVPAAHKYGLDPNLIAAIMTMESDGDPLAWNGGSDARGLMQVLHGPWDPKTNVDLGARMLSQFFSEFQDLTLALAAYNAGPNAVLAYDGVPPYRETRDYVIVVAYLYDLFSHRKLTRKRRAQYRVTLRDLQRFADQRKKVHRLALTAHLPLTPDLDCRSAQACNQPNPIVVFSSLDPFWPIGEAPDPLQRVDPYVRSMSGR